MKWTCTPCAPRPTTSQPAPCLECCGYRAERIVVDAETWDALNERLAEPAQIRPRLAALLRKAAS